MFGLNRTGCNDIGGGEHIGDAAAIDWLKYKVNVATASTCNITFRVASFKTTELASFQIRNSTVILATEAVQNSDVCIAWTTINVSVSLVQGSQTRTIFNVVYGFNLYRFEFSAGTL
jgi:glucosylceramidase